MSQSSSGALGWQLEGNAPLAYDIHIVDVFLQDYSRRFVEVAAIKPGDRVLDVACGTGVVTQLAANKVGSTGQVVGFDLNAGISREHALLVKQPRRLNGVWAALQTCRLLMRLSTVSLANNMACSSFLIKPPPFPKCTECWPIEVG
jgi:SAM-dependent methyltransferase